jgi:hypothetical protein
MVLGLLFAFGIGSVMLGPKLGRLVTVTIGTVTFADRNIK